MNENAPATTASDSSQEDGRKPIDILIVEDNSADLMIMMEALSETGVPLKIHTVSDGEEAMKYLRHVGEYADSPRPQLVLLDLNMPRKNGHEVLEEIKCDRFLMRIPVVVITTSLADHDIAQAYSSHANCCIHKPVDFHEFCAAMELVKTFWFETVKLPDQLPSAC